MQTAVGAVIMKRGGPVCSKNDALVGYDSNHDRGEFVFHDETGGGRVNGEKEDSDYGRVHAGLRGMPGASGEGPGPGGIHGAAGAAV